MKDKRFSFEEDVIKANSLSNSLIIGINQENTEQPSYLFCTKVQYLHERSKKLSTTFFDHHIMIYYGKNLIFKVWLPNEDDDPEFKDVKEALASVGMEVRYPHEA